MAVLLAAALHMLLFDRGLGGDGWAGFATLESLADDGDAWVEDDSRGVMNGLVGTPEGHLVMQYPPGVLALDTLPFLAGRLADRLLPESWLANGFELPPAGRVPRGVFLSAAMIVLARNAVTLLGLLWTFRALRRMEIPEGVAAMATALAFFGGPLIFYSLVGMTHAPVFALAGLLLLLLARQRENGSFSLALAAGAVIGAAVLLRYGSIALAAPALLAISWRRWPAFAAGLVPFLLILPLWWRWLFGAWSPPYGGTWAVTAASPWNVLFSPVHGLFLFHPALLLAVVGLAVAIARRSPWGTIGAVWFLAVAVLYGWWSEWSNAGGYGQRFLTDALPALGIGFAAFLQGKWTGFRKTAAVALALLGWLLFFAAVGGLAAPPPGLPWPQTLGDYAPLLRHPPGPAELADALRRASLPVRAIAGPAR
jgi:uncharacterized membrane protein YoaK (UPF0700 family)